MADSPIFIVGTPRSGTSLVAKILGKHSSLFVPGETHFFSTIYSRRNELGELNNLEASDKVVKRLLSLYGRSNEPADQVRISKLTANNPEFTKNLSGCKSYRELFSMFMQEQAAYEGKKRWGNKVPKDIFHIDEILSFYPDAKIIICVRDMRAFLLSYQGKWKITAEDRTERMKKLYHPVVTSLLWKSSMRLIPKIRTAVKDENFIIVPYEELVEKPHDVVSKICRTIGEKYESTMLDVTSNNSSHGVASGGIFKASVSKWKTDLSAEEIWVSQKIASKELKDLGYDLKPVNPNFPKLTKIIVGTPAALLRALSANKEHRGSLVPYVIKRILLLISSSPTR